eukprot:10363300-Alexandrium_andersonii.AAC.1
MLGPLQWQPWAADCATRNAAPTGAKSRNLRSSAPIDSTPWMRTLRPSGLLGWQLYPYCT